MAASNKGAKSRKGSSSSGSSSNKTTLAASLSTAGMLDIVDRLGLVDLAVGQVKSRLENVDVDEVVDEVGDYLKKNPEVLVVSLGAVTLAAGALVYLSKRNETPSGSGRKRK